MILFGLMFNYTDDSQTLAVTIFIVAVNVVFYITALRMKIGSKLAEAKRKKAKKAKRNLNKVAPSVAPSLDKLEERANKAWDDPEGN